MAYQIHCPRCRLLMGVTGDDMGTECACPACATKFTVPPPPPQPRVLILKRPIVSASAPPPESPSSAAVPKRKRKAPEGWLLGACVVGALLLFMLPVMMQGGSPYEGRRKAEPFDFAAMMPPSHDRSPEANQRRKQLENFKAEWAAHQESMEKLRRTSPRTTRIKIRKFR